MAGSRPVLRRALAGALLAVVGVLGAAPALAARGAARVPQRAPAERAALERAALERAPAERAEQRAARRADATAPPVPVAPAQALSDVRALLERGFELDASQRAALASIFAAQGQRLRAAQVALAVDPALGARIVRSLVAETYRAVQLVLAPEQRRPFARAVIAAGLGEATGAAADAAPPRRLDPAAVHRFLSRAVAEGQRRGAKAGGKRAAGRRGGARRGGGRRGR